MLQVDNLIAAVLRGESPLWPENGGDAFSRLFLERSAYHGVQALLHQSISDAKLHELGWPKPVLDACRDAAFGQAMWEMRHKEILGRVLAAITRQGVRPIIFKGAALAYKTYPAPFARTRGDTDLLVPSQAREQACTALEACGFACVLGRRGDLISYTAVYSLDDPSLGVHEIDLHWRISNTQILSRLFSYDELAASAEPLPRLSPDAFAPSDMQALAIACMHRAGHKECPYYVDGVEYYGGDRLIWFYDMHLICKMWKAAEYEAFFTFAAEKGLLRICLEGLERTRELFGSGPPSELVEKHRDIGANESVSRYLAGAPLYQYYANLAAVEGFSNKIGYLTETFFPPEKYMRKMYGEVAPNWLGWLYLHRITTILAKRLKRTLIPWFKAHGDAGRR